jgi:hypothetical protein
MKRNVTLAICFAIVFAYSLTYSSGAYAAVGCNLTDPDRDVKRIFPQSTSYKTSIDSVKERGGDKISKDIEIELGDKLDPIYETNDIPHTIYTVLKGKDIIGYIHGVNQKGMYGGMQIILAVDKKGKILEFYYQKVSSPEDSKFKDAKFTNQFKNLTLADFLHHDAMKGQPCPDDKIAKIKPPTSSNNKDFANTLRGVKMDLILNNVFIFNNFKRTKSL